MRRVRRGSLVTSACAATLMTFAAPAVAGGTWLEFEGDPIAVTPGQTIRGIATVHPGTQGTVDDGPFYVYLRLEVDDDAVSVEPAAERIGPVSEVRIGERSGPNVLVEVEFVVPDVPPGEWWVDVCNANCETGLGDLIGGLLTIADAAARDELPETGSTATLLGVAVILLVGGALILRAGTRVSRA